MSRPNGSEPLDPDVGLVAQSQTIPRPRGRVRELADVVLVAIIFALFVRTFLVQAFVVPSGSMEKTVLVGDHLLVNKFLYAPHGGLLSALLPYRDVRRGDVIVFKFPEDPSRDFIKRAVALPGDVLEIRNGNLFVNGVAESRPPAGARWRHDPENSAMPPRRGDLRPQQIPAGTFFALGDNRENSYDSRYWGPVPNQNLKGRALFIYWSFAPNLAGQQSGPLERFLDILHSTRWSRTFLIVR